MSTTVGGGAKSAQQIQQDSIRKRANNRPMTGQQMVKKTIKLINSAAGAPMNQNFIDKAPLDA